MFCFLLFFAPPFFLPSTTPLRVEAKRPGPLRDALLARGVPLDLVCMWRGCGAGVYGRALWAGPMPGLKAGAAAGPPCLPCLHSPCRTPFPPRSTDLLLHDSTHRPKKEKVKHIFSPCFSFFSLFFSYRLEEASWLISPSESRYLVSLCVSSTAGRGMKKGRKTGDGWRRKARAKKKRMKKNALQRIHIALLACCQTFCIHGVEQKKKKK